MLQVRSVPPSMSWQTSEIRSVAEGMERAVGGRLPFHAGAALHRGGAELHLGARIAPRHPCIPRSSLFVASRARFARASGLWEMLVRMVTSKVPCLTGEEAWHGATKMSRLIRKPVILTPCLRCTHSQGDDYFDTSNRRRFVRNT